MKKVSLPGSNASFAIARFVTDHGGMGPAVLGVLLEPGKAQHDIFWIFQNGHNINQQQKSGFTFTLDSFSRLYYTGIQVSKDPGVPLVWIGFCLIMMGFILSLFFTHKRIWMKISGFARINMKFPLPPALVRTGKPLRKSWKGLTGKITVE